MAAILNPWRTENERKKQKVGGCEKRNERKGEKSKGEHCTFF